MLFTVIVPFLNEEGYIARCAESLLEQDLDRDQYEIIFVDNGSTDESCAIVGRYPRINLLHEDTKGSYAARNRGIREAGGQIFAFTDADCEVVPDWLSQIRNGMRDESTAVVAGRRLLATRERRGLQMLEDYENAKVEYLLSRPDLKQHYFGFTNNMAFRASVFERCGPFPEIMRGGDTQYVQRFLSKDPDSVMRYLSGMVILHFEVDSLWRWLKKKAIRGQHNRNISRVSNYRQLGLKERARIFSLSAEENGYSFVDAAWCFALLATGNGFYKLGAITSTLARMAY